jgi:4-hydroxy-4-methyl-2-oxoglutarate aldolase
VFADAALSTADLADFLRPSAEIRGVRQVAGESLMLGPARTLRAVPGGTDGVYGLLGEAQPGDVLVIDFGGPDVEPAAFGDLMAAEARRRLVAGVVVWGRARDVEGLREVGLPVFAAGVTPTTGEVRGAGETQVPVVLDGVTVRPGDTVAGDVNGVLVGQGPLDDTVLADATRAATANAAVRRRVEAGEPLLEIAEIRAYLDAVYRPRT